MKKLFVGNLPYAANETDVQSFFSGHGVTVDTVTVMRDRFTGQARGFGFVEINDDCSGASGRRQLPRQGTDGAHSGGERGAPHGLARGRRRPSAAARTRLALHGRRELLEDVGDRLLQLLFVLLRVGRQGVGAHAVPDHLLCFPVEDIDMQRADAGAVDDRRAVRRAAGDPPTAMIPASAKSA